MRKLYLCAAAIVAAFSFAAPARAQYTTVSATVKDPNNIPYANGTVNAVLVPSSTGPWRLNGQPYSGTLANSALDSTGSFTVSMGDNGQITPASTQWLFTVCSNQGGIPLPLGTGNQCFMVGPLTITGVSQSISTQINAAAASLTNFLTSGAGTVTAVSCGNLAPLFTCAVATATSTPAISYMLSTAASETVFGNPGGSTAAPVFTNAPVVHTITAQNAVTGFMAYFTGINTSAPANTFVAIVGDNTGNQIIEMINASVATLGIQTLANGTFSLTDAPLGGGFGTDTSGNWYVQPNTNKLFYIGGPGAATPNGIGSVVYDSATGLVHFYGTTSGNATIAASATGSLLDLNGTAATMDASGNLTVNSCTGCGSVSLSFPLTVGGTTSSGGIPYFSNATTLTSSAALTHYGVVYGGGAGGAPVSTAADTTTTHALFATATAPAFRAIAVGDIPTLNQNTTGTASNVTGTVAIANGGTGQTTAPNALIALFPVATRSGDVIYWDGSVWNHLAGNNSGTEWLQETSGGVPSWTTPSGNISGLTTGVFPKAASSTTIANSLCDEGITTANVFTCTDTLGASFEYLLRVAADGTHPGNLSLVGNTTVATVAANTFNIMGPNAATFTAYSLQFSSTGPAAAGVALVGAPSSNVSQVTFGTVPNSDLTNSATTVNGQTCTLGSTCTLTLASSNFANQGTTTTVLHGNASGNPAFSAVSLTADVTGTLSVANGGTGQTSGTVTFTIASGTSALGTGAITSGTCATVVTTTATGTAATDNIEADFNADPTSTTGYSPSASGMLTIIKYPTTNNVNFKVCNNTGGSITPGAVTLNWRVVR